MIWPFAGPKSPQATIVATNNSKPLIRVSEGGEVTFDWPAIRAYLETPDDGNPLSVAAARIALAAFNEGVAEFDGALARTKA